MGGGVASPDVRCFSIFFCSSLYPELIKLCLGKCWQGSEGEKWDRYLVFAQRELLRSIYWFPFFVENRKKCKWPSLHFQSIFSPADCFNRSIDQWNRTGSPEINPHTYGQLIYLWQKKARMYDGENTISSTSGVRKWTAVCKTMTLEHFFTLYTKINSK